jgi:uncharacterized protein (DUF433 family)
MVAAVLTPREVAELADAPRSLVEKAIEQRVLRAVKGRLPSVRREVRLLPIHAVGYAATMKTIGSRLTVDDKKRVAEKLANLAPADLRTAEVDLSPAITVRVGELVGDSVERAARYAVNRDTHIEINDEVMGGTPVIRGTRITVYSVVGRLDHGDRIEDLLEDYPHVSREAFEAAAIYARTHPFVGRPGGRPWERT